MLGVGSCIVWNKAVIKTYCVLLCWGPAWTMLHLTSHLNTRTVYSCSSHCCPHFNCEELKPKTLTCPRSLSHQERRRSSRWAHCSIVVPTSLPAVTWTHSSTTNCPKGGQCFPGPSVRAEDDFLRIPTPVCACTHVCICECACMWFCVCMHVCVCHPEPYIFQAVLYHWVTPSPLPALVWIKKWSLEGRGEGMISF